jgi:Asp-tRNA(Asn)/Glu-tRNA(Gln) amidotransferase A subunit family amidase
MGRHFGETMLFRIARRFEQATGIQDQKPVLD